jgi:hypothetical protein
MIANFHAMEMRVTCGGRCAPLFPAVATEGEGIHASYLTTGVIKGSWRVSPVPHRGCDH